MKASAILGLVMALAGPAYASQDPLGTAKRAWTFARAWLGREIRA